MDGVSWDVSKLSMKLLGNFDKVLAGVQGVFSVVQLTLLSNDLYSIKNNPDTGCYEKLILAFSKIINSDLPILYSIRSTVYKNTAIQIYKKTWSMLLSRLYNTNGKHSYRVVYVLYSIILFRFVRLAGLFYYFGHTMPSFEEFYNAPNFDLIYTQLYFFLGNYDPVYQEKANRHSTEFRGFVSPVAAGGNLDDQRTRGYLKEAFRHVFHPYRNSGEHGIFTIYAPLVIIYNYSVKFAEYTSNMVVDSVFPRPSGDFRIPSCEKFDYKSRVESRFIPGLNNCEEYFKNNVATMALSLPDGWYKALGLASIPSFLAYQRYFKNRIQNEEDIKNRTSTAIVSRNWPMIIAVVTIAMAVFIYLDDQKQKNKKQVKQSGRARIRR